MRKDFRVVEEDEIDLRPYIITVLRHWRLIVGITVAAAVVAAVFSLAAPRSYEATATVALTNLGTKPVPDVKAYLELATGDPVVSALVERLAGEMGASAPSPADLRGTIKATAGPDPSLITLRVLGGDPARLARIATGWATVVAQAANSTYNLSGDAAAQFERQLALERERLGKAEGELETAQTRNGLELLRMKLDAQQRILTSLYFTRTNLEAAAASAGTLRDRFRKLDPTSPANPGDDVSFMLVQAQVQGVTVQVQSAGTAVMSGRTVGAQLATLENLVQLIAERQRDTGRQMDEVSASIVEMQARIQQGEEQEAPLLAARDNARATVKELDQKANQARAAVRAGVNQARLVGEIPVPVDPLPRGTTRNAAVAGMLGLMLGVAAAFGMEYLATRRIAGNRVPEPVATMAEGADPAKS